MRSPPTEPEFGGGDCETAADGRVLAMAVDAGAATAGNLPGGVADVRAATAGGGAQVQLSAAADVNKANRCRLACTQLIKNT